MNVFDQLLAFFGMLSGAFALFAIAAVLVHGGAFVLDRLREREQLRDDLLRDALRRPDVLCSMSKGWTR